MTINVVDTASGSSGVNPVDLNLTLSSGAGNNRLVVACLCRDNASSWQSFITSSRIDGIQGINSGIEYITGLSNAGVTYVYWTDDMLPAGAGPITITNTQAGDYNWGAIALEGVDQTTPIRAHNGVTGHSSGDRTVGGLTTQAGELVIATAAGQYGSTNISNVTAGLVTIFNNIAIQATGRCHGAYVFDLDAVTFNFSNGNSGNTMAAIVIQEGGPAGVQVTHTIDYSEAATYTGSAPTGGGTVEGLKFTRDGIDALDVEHQTDMRTPNKLINYLVTWPDDIVAGQVIAAVYDRATGKYVGSDGRDMDDQTLQVVNCEELTPTGTPVINSITPGDTQLIVDYSFDGPFGYAEFFDGGVSMGQFDDDTDRTKTLGNLTNGQSYDITMIVYSVGEFLPSPESNMISGTPVASGVTLNAPTGFDITNGSETSSSLAVTWTPPTQGDATEYRVKNGPLTVGTVAWPASGMTVTGLSANTSYTLTVVTSDGSLESSASNSDTASTLSAGGSTYTRFDDFESYTPGVSINSIYGMGLGNESYIDNSPAIGSRSARCDWIEGQFGTSSFGWGRQYGQQAKDGDIVRISIDCYYPSSFQFVTPGNGTKFIRGGRQTRADGSFDTSVGFIDLYHNNTSGSNWYFRVEGATVANRSFTHNIPKDQWTTVVYEIGLGTVLKANGGNAYQKFQNEGFTFEVDDYWPTLKRADYYYSFMYFYTYWNGAVPKNQSAWFDNFKIEIIRNGT